MRRKRIEDTIAAATAAPKCHLYPIVILAMRQTAPAPVRSESVMRIRLLRRSRAAREAASCPDADTVVTIPRLHLDQAIASRQSRRGAGSTTYDTIFQYTPVFLHLV